MTRAPLEDRNAATSAVGTGLLPAKDADLQQVGQGVRDQLRCAVLLLLLRDALLGVGGAGVTVLLVLPGRRPALQAAA